MNLPPQLQLRLDGRPDWSAVPRGVRARAILDYYDRNPAKFRERRELEHHMEHHPSERWAAKLETVKLVLGWAQGGA